MQRYLIFIKIIKAAFKTKKGFQNVFIQKSSTA